MLMFRAVLPSWEARTPTMLICHDVTLFFLPMERSKDDKMSFGSPFYVSCCELNWSFTVECVIKLAIKESAKGSSIPNCFVILVDEECGV